MFDEIFKRWVNTNQLTQDDIIPLFLNGIRLLVMDKQDQNMYWA